MASLYNCYLHDAISLYGMELSSIHKKKLIGQKSIGNQEVFVFSKEHIV